MASLQVVRASNSKLKELGPGLVAVFGQYAFSLSLDLSEDVSMYIMRI